MKKEMTRREFLRASLAGAGLTIAVSFSPLGVRILSASEAAKDSAAFTPDVWIRLTSDNILTVIVNKSEMGQGVFTSLPMVIADELDVDWDNVRVEAAPAAERYKDPVWGVQATGGSSSIRHMCDTLRKAGAAAHEMLVNAAAVTWGVPSSECETEMGAVRHPRSKRSLTYGELVNKASAMQVPKNPTLKKKSQCRYIGSSVPRLDIPEKVRGSARFGIDASVPGMLYASVSRPPAYGSKPVSIDREAALGIRGVTHVIPVGTGTAVCAETPDVAWKGRAALKAVWDKGAHPDLDTSSLERLFVKDLEKDGVTARSDGDARASLAQAAKKVEATYLLPFLAHTTMEPMNCTAHVGPERCDIWAATQNQTGVLKVAERLTGLRPEQIHVHTTYLGGGFGRRFELDVAEEAISISKETQKPVKLIWTREEDVQNDFYRPASSTKITGGIDAKDRLVAWSHKIVCPSIFLRVFPEQVKEGIDPAAVEGLRNMEYEVPNIHVEYVKIDTPVPVGFWRSVGSSHNAFTVESFIDEIAEAARRDPLELRLELLANHKRASRVLDVVAEKAGWTRPLASGRGRGISYHFSFESYAAQVAEVSVDKKEGKIRVHRVVCAIDCGRVVNPAIVTAQLESGIIMGLSAALKEKIVFGGGGVGTSNFHDYDLLRMDEIPEIEVHIVKSTDKSGGVGEPGVPPAGPAVANAVFQATGIRLRQLPMTPANLLAAAGKA